MVLSEMPQYSPLEEYGVNQILTLNVRRSSFIHARIRQLHTRTLSCTMVVDILDDDQPPATSSTAFLKLFDRRFADQLRRNNGIDPWTINMEEGYVQSIKSGAINQFLQDLHQIENFQEDTEEDWNDAQNEAFLADEMLKLYESETATYDALQDHQGRLTPQLLEVVDLNLAPSNSELEGGGQDEFEHYKVNGILLQYINGFSLWDMPDHTPQAIWQDIVDQAVAIIGVLGDHNILNRDVRPENFLVIPTPQTPHQQHQQQYHVLMIDFALCRFRGKDESDLEWGRAKHSKDEEGAIALRMKKKLLEEYGFQLRYKDSLRYVEWADREDNFIAGAVKKEVRPGVVLYSRGPEGVE